MFKIKRLFQSKIFGYVANKYLVYGIQFISSFFLAKYLGVYYLGLYGFIQIMLQYFSYSNLGVNYSLNLFLSVKEYSKYDKNQIWSVSLLITAAVSLALFAAAVFFYAFDIKLFEKFHLPDYIFLIVIIIVLRHIGLLYTNLYRIFGKLNKINIYTALPPIGIFISLFFFKSEGLFYAILYAQILAYAAAMLIFARKSPLKFSLEYSREIPPLILKKGFNLLLYNLSFYLMMLLSRTMVGAFYSVEILGYFTFAYSLMTAVLMLIDSLNFVFYSKILKRFSELREKTEIIELLDKIRSLYIFGINLTGFLSFAFLPLLSLALPEYSESLSSFKILMVAQIIINNNFGYSTLLISRGMEKKLMKIGFVSILAIFIFGMLFAAIFKMNYEFVALATIFGAVIYSVLTLREGNKMLNRPQSSKVIMSELFPLKYCISYGIILASALTDVYATYSGMLAFVIFAFLNYRELSGLKANVDKILNYKIEIMN
jgi:O-antigen/teichoic acid export membrane protein